MRETIRRRRAALEDAIEEHLPEGGPFDRCRSELRSMGRPRVRGQVCLAMVDGLVEEWTLEDVLPVAAAVELAALQTRVHRTAFDLDRSADDLTARILQGDLLESTAFEVMIGARDSPAIARRCLAVLVRATRHVQEGQAIQHGPEADAPADLERRLGALTGAGAELAAILADREGSRRAMARDGSRFGFHVEYGDDVADEPQALEALTSHCPDPTRGRVRRQLRHLLEGRTAPGSTDSVV